MLFKDVMVDDSIKESLINLVKSNRVSHAQLFLCSPGNHSFALAVAYAQYLSCQNRGEHDSCGVCPSCLKFEKLSHPDFHLIFPNVAKNSNDKDYNSKKWLPEFREYVFENNYHISLNSWLKELGGENKQATINIRDCGNIVEQNSIRAYEGGYKIYLLWMVERLYHAAAPKLLKTLEEPENKTLFILMTENPDKILSTIKSRTQYVKIPPLTEATIAQHLQREFDVSEELAKDIASISEGNYVKAMTLAHDNKEQEEMLHHFECFFNGVTANDGKHPLNQVNFNEVRESIEKISKLGRESQKNFVQYMGRMLRNILLINTNNEALVKATHEERDLLNFYKTRVTVFNAKPLMEECNKAHYHIERNGNTSLIMTDMFLKMSTILAS